MEANQLKKPPPDCSTRLGGSVGFNVELFQRPRVLETRSTVQSKQVKFLSKSFRF